MEEAKIHRLLDRLIDRSLSEEECRELVKKLEMMAKDKNLDPLQRMNAIFLRASLEARTVHA